MTDHLYLIASAGFGANSNTGHHKAWSHTQHNAFPLEHNILQKEQ
jgi:hypothetical protein